MTRWWWGVFGVSLGVVSVSLPMLKQPDAAAAPQGLAKLALPRRCGTPDVLDNKLLTAIRQKLAQANQAPGAAVGTIVIPVQFIHLRDGALGAISEQQRIDQIQVLNDDFAGSGIEFSYTAAPIEVDNADWYHMGFGSQAEKECKAALQVDPETTLNFYTCEADDLLGWSTFPWELASDPELDGVVIKDTTLPGGTEPNYNLGRTATHEIGHWVGLFHTFQGSCGLKGDEVDDTVAHIQANSGCPPDGRNGACKASQQAPIHNYMNYTYDACMTGYTSGQQLRMNNMLSAYRTKLSGGGGCECFLDCLAVRISTPFPLPRDLLPQFRALRDNLLGHSADGRRMIRLYYAHSAEIFRLMAADPGLGARSARVLLAALPADAGASGFVRISPALYDEGLILLERLETQSSPELTDAIADVRAILARSTEDVDGKVVLTFSPKRSTVADHGPVHAEQAQ